MSTASGTFVHLTSTGHRSIVLLHFDVNRVGVHPVDGLLRNSFVCGSVRSWCGVSVDGVQGQLANARKGSQAVRNLQRPVIKASTLAQLNWYSAWYNQCCNLYQVLHRDYVQVAVQKDES